ncbi:ABC-three component system middle component 7 [Anaerotignum lactatifermentans]|uniref:ABC-three component system middle component 7 n=1 Tax=Anaerotignum lactatifermentans TaxID=160404 RepID=UPI002ED07A72
MIFPDKLVSFQDSIIAKSVYILKELQNNELVVSDLFIATKEYFEDVSEFLLALDTLYLLGKINLNDKSQVIQYAEKN